MTTDPLMARARIVAQGLVSGLVLARAAAAQGVGRGDGARAPIGPARGAVDLCELVRPRGGDMGDEPTTPIGYRTARVRPSPLPPLLAGLPETDRLVMVVRLYADRVERVGSVPICDISGASGSVGVSDGGAVTRVAWASDLAEMVACLGGVALPVVRGGRGRRSIPVRVAVDAVCLGRGSVRGVLSAHGWRTDGKNAVALSGAILEALGRMADHMGY